MAVARWSTGGKAPRKQLAPRPNALPPPRPRVLTAIGPIQSASLVSDERLERLIRETVRTRPDPRRLPYSWKASELRHALEYATGVAELRVRRPLILRVLSEIRLARAANGMDEKQAIASVIQSKRQAESDEKVATAAAAAFATAMIGTGAGRSTGTGSAPPPPGGADDSDVPDFGGSFKPLPPLSGAKEIVVDPATDPEVQSEYAKNRRNRVKLRAGDNKADATNVPRAAAATAATAAADKKTNTAAVATPAVATTATAKGKPNSETAATTNSLKADASLSTDGVADQKAPPAAPPPHPYGSRFSEFEFSVPKYEFQSYGTQALSARPIFQVPVIFSVCEYLTPAEWCGRVMTTHPLLYRILSNSANNQMIGSLWRRAAFETWHQSFSFATASAPVLSALSRIEWCAYVRSRYPHFELYRTRATAIAERVLSGSRADAQTQTGRAAASMSWAEHFKRNPTAANRAAPSAYPNATPNSLINPYAAANGDSDDDDDASDDSTPEMNASELAAFLGVSPRAVTISLHLIGGRTYGHLPNVQPEITIAGLGSIPDIVSYHTAATAFNREMRELLQDLRVQLTTHTTGPPTPPPAVTVYPIAHHSRAGTNLDNFRYSEAEETHTATVAASIAVYVDAMPGSKPLIITAEQELDSFPVLRIDHHAFTCTATAASAQANPPPPYDDGEDENDRPPLGAGEDDYERDNPFYSFFQFFERGWNRHFRCVNSPTDHMIEILSLALCGWNDPYDPAADDAARHAWDDDDADRYVWHADASASADAAGSAFGSMMPTERGHLRLIERRAFKPAGKPTKPVRALAERILEVFIEWATPPLNGVHARDHKRGKRPHPIDYAKRHTARQFAVAPNAPDAPNDPNNARPVYGGKGPCANVARSFVGGKKVRPAK